MFQQSATKWSEIAARRREGAKTQIKTLPETKYIKKRDMSQTRP